MIVKIFKTNQVYIYAVIPFLLILLRLPALFSAPTVNSVGYLPMVTTLFEQLSGFPVWAALIGIVLITVQSYHLSKICEEHRLMAYSTNLPAFILAINYSIFPEYNYLSPALAANTFLIVALRRTANIYNQNRIDGALFRAGIYIGFASLIYPPAVIMSAVLLYNLYIFRTFQWREYVIPLLAALIPHIYVLAYFFLNDQTAVLYELTFSNRHYFLAFEYRIPRVAVLAVVVLISVPAFVYLITSGQKRIIRTNNLFKVIASMLLITALFAWGFSQDVASASMLCLPSLSIVQSYYLIDLEKKWLREGLVYLFIAGLAFREMAVRMG